MIWEMEICKELEGIIIKHVIFLGFNRFKLIKGQLYAELK